MARFDNPLSLMLNAEGVQITGGGATVKGIFTENGQRSGLRETKEENSPTKTKRVLI